MERTKFPIKSTNKTGPKIMLNEIMLEQATYLSSKGKTQRQIAKKLNISLGTVENWMRTQPRFREAVKKGEQEAIQNVKKAFYELATGYSHPDTVILSNRMSKEHFDADGKLIAKTSWVEPLIVPITKHYPPNALAALKWLTIKDRANWMDTQKLEINQQINIQNNIDLSDFTDTELMALEKIGMKKLISNVTEQFN